MSIVLFKHRTIARKFLANQKDTRQFLNRPTGKKIRKGQGQVQLAAIKYGTLAEKMASEVVRVVGMNRTEAEEHRRRRLKRRAAERAVQLQGLVEGIFDATAERALDPTGLLSYHPKLCRRGPAEAAAFDWTRLPSPLDPLRALGVDGELRGQRKRWQIESLATVVARVCAVIKASEETRSADATRRIRIADFGCGSGVLTVPLAAFLPG